MLKRRISIFLILTLLLAIISITFITAFASSGQTVTVDLSSNLGSPDYKAAGFLHAFDQTGTIPADSLIRPLKPKLFRGAGTLVSGGGWLKGGYTAYQPRLTYLLNQYQRIASWGGVTYNVLLSDLYGYPAYDDPSAPYPGDNGDWSTWDAFLAQVVSDINANGIQGYLEIWNEPDGSSFWNRPVSQYNELWRRSVVYIRAHVPNAKILGPSYEDYNSGEMSSWLDTVKANGTVPDVLSWHFSGDPVGDAANANSLLSSKSISGVSLVMNEYIFNGSQSTAGYTAWYMGRIEKSALYLSSHAIWGSPFTGTLDDILNSNHQTKGQWWVYKRYADITGSLVSVTNSANIDGVAGKDTASSRIVLGNNGGYSGNVDVNITNLSSVANLVIGNQVNITVEQIPDADPLSTPVIQQSSNFNVSNNQVTVTLPWSTTTDSFAIYVSAPTGGGGGTNLALGKTASASSIWGAGYEASKANDNDFGTRWNAADATGVGEWLQIDFGTNTTFNKTTLTQCLNRITGYKIQYWNGSSWIDAYTGGTLGASRTDTFSAVTGSKARLYITGIQSDGQNTAPSIYEFQIFNETGGYTSFDTAITTGDLRNDYGNWVGTKITVGNSNITVKQLGRYFVTGNSGTHTLAIYTTDGTQVASVSIDMSSGSTDSLGFKYATLSSPYTLSANTSYYIVSLESSGGDQWYGNNTMPTLTTTSVATVNGAVFYTGSYWNYWGAAGTSYVPLNFKY